MTNNNRFPYAPPSMRSEMDDNELTMLAMEIAKDTDFADLSTQCNNNVGNRKPVSLLPEMSGASHSLDHLIRTTLSPQYSSFTNMEEGDEPQIVSAEYPHSPNPVQRLQVDHLLLGYPNNSDVSASIDKATIVSGLSTNDSLRQETLPPIPMTPSSPNTNNNSVYGHSNPVTPIATAVHASPPFSNHQRLSNRDGNTKHSGKPYSKRQAHPASPQQYGFSRPTQHIPSFQSAASPKQIIINCPPHDFDLDAPTPSLPGTPPSDLNHNVNPSHRSPAFAPGAAPNSMRHHAVSPYLTTKPYTNASKTKSARTPPPKHNVHTFSANPSPSSMHFSTVYATEQQQVSPSMVHEAEPGSAIHAMIDTTQNIVPMAKKRTRRNTNHSANTQAMSGQMHTNSVRPKSLKKKSKRKQHKKSKYDSDALYVVKSSAPSDAQQIHIAKLEMQCVDDGDDSKQYQLAFDSEHEQATKSNRKSKTKESRLVCQCNEKLSKMKNRSKAVFCSQCGTECAINTFIYHCKQEKNAVHPHGYDLCGKCGKKRKKKRERSLKNGSGVAGKKKKRVRARKCASDQLYRIHDHEQSKRDEFTATFSPRAKSNSVRKDVLLPSSPFSTDSADLASDAPSSPREPLPYFVKRPAVPSIAQYRSYDQIHPPQQHARIPLQSKSNGVLHGFPKHRDNEEKEIRMNRVRTTGDVYTGIQRQKKTLRVTSPIAINAHHHFEYNNESQVYSMQAVDVNPEIQKPRRLQKKLKSPNVRSPRRNTDQIRKNGLNAAEDEEYAIETADGFIFVSKDKYESLLHLQL